VILPDSVLEVTESFCACPSLTLVGVGQVPHLKNLSGFLRTALADVLIPATVEIVAGFVSDAELPPSASRANASLCSARLASRVDLASLDTRQSFSKRNASRFLAGIHTQLPIRRLLISTSE
jgi:hypothetical protein